MAVFEVVHLFAQVEYGVRFCFGSFEVGIRLTPL